MKKTYISPETAIVPIVTEGIIATSPGLGISDTEKITDESEFLSDKGDWKNPIWSDGE